MFGFEAWSRIETLEYYWYTDIKNKLQVNDINRKSRSVLNPLRPHCSYSSLKPIHNVLHFCY